LLFNLDKGIEKKNAITQHSIAVGAMTTTLQKRVGAIKQIILNKKLISNNNDNKKKKKKNKNMTMVEF